MHPRRLFRCLLVLPITLTALAQFAPHAATATAGTWTVTGSMHQARSFQTATLLPSGLVLVVGGYDNGNGTLASAELYHPHTGSWAGTGSMHEPRIQHTATLLPSGQVLVAGGCTNSCNATTLASAELYDPRTGTWTMTGSMHEPRAYHTATLLPTGRVLVAGGVADGCFNATCSGILASAELYDPHTGRWTLSGSLHQARARHVATLLHTGQVLVAGGAADGANSANSNALASAELYDPRRGSWTVTGSMHDARSSSTANLLPSGLVLVAGGSNNGAVLRAELYHPHTGAWTVTGSMHVERAYETAETATLLPSGMVFVAGSVEVIAGDNPGNNASAELYHPSTGTWTVTSSMRNPREFQTATLLSSGLVLVAGGATTTNSGPLPLDSAELYNP